MMSDSKIDQDVRVPVALLVERINQIEAVTQVARNGPRHGVTPREAALYDKGFDDAIRFVRESVERLTHA